MIRLEFYNNNTGDGFLFGRSPLYYHSVSGLATFDSSTVAFKIPRVDGYNRQYSTVDERTIVIEGRAKAKSKLELVKLRRQMIRNFHCKHNELYELKAITEDNQQYMIKCFCENGIETEDVQEHGLEWWIMPYKITLTCPDPYWRQEDVFKAKYASIEGKFFFELEIEADNPNDQIFGEVIKRQNIKVVNKGDVPTGFTIIAEGNNTGFVKISLEDDPDVFILVNKGTISGERLVINCHDGDKSIRFYDEFENDQNAFKYLNENTTFFNLNVGDNYLVVETGDSGDDQDITLEFQNQYIGV